ncbi:hypothetical protein LXL04_017354 [Taraxacum kok-saghyz]
MEAFLEQFPNIQHFDLQEMKSTTGNFDEKKVIGKGGFGKVYESVLAGEMIKVALKRLNENSDQGNREFLKEIIMLSRYTHNNIISLVGFCDQDGEKILVYEHAYHGSLECHLHSMTLTWTERLKICIGAARGLSYLHEPNEFQQRVIHRDIKSSNILLDENWNAKVSDMGLSKIGSTNQQQSFLATDVAGTFCYVDPVYMETNILTKESDVYSFGVVLFEVLCGRQRVEYNNSGFQSLVRSWKKSYKEKKLDEIIFHNLKQDMDIRSLGTYSEIAYQCLQSSRTKRPKMSEVVEKLEISLRFQLKLSKIDDFKEMVKSVANKEELESLLCNGIIVNGGNTWFSVNKNGEHCEMISPELHDTIGTYPIKYGETKSRYAAFSCRFELSNRRIFYIQFSVDIKTKFLSPNITYKVNIVFIHGVKRWDNLSVQYKSPSETNYLVSFVAHERRDGWLTAELYQFINVSGNIDLKIEFRCLNGIDVEGIEFVPVEKVHLEDEDVDLQTDTYWEQKLPSDYEEIIKCSKDSLQWNTKKELCSIFSNGSQSIPWISLTKNGKKCHMLSAKLALSSSSFRWQWQSLPESRCSMYCFCESWVASGNFHMHMQLSTMSGTYETFVFTTLYGPPRLFRPTGANRYFYMCLNDMLAIGGGGNFALCLDEDLFKKAAFDPVEDFSIDIKSNILSPKTTYATYLVYKLQENHSWFEHPVRCDRVYGCSEVKFPPRWFIYLLSPEAATITEMVSQNKRLPQQRNDGWMEVQVYEFQTDTQRVSTDVMLMLADFKSLKGLIVQGIEFKPI